MQAEAELNEVPRVLQTKVPDSLPPLAPARPVSISLGLVRSPILGGLLCFKAMALKGHYWNPVPHMGILNSRAHTRDVGG